MSEEKHQWRGGAGGCPILSQPIADINRYPFGRSGTAPLWVEVLAVPFLILAAPVVLVMKMMGRLK